jgi:hypothetical protein
VERWWYLEMVREAILTNVIELRRKGEGEDECENRQGHTCHLALAAT